MGLGCISYNDVPSTLLVRFRTVQYNSLDDGCPSRLNAWIQSRGLLFRALMKGRDYGNARRKKITVQ